MIKENSIILFQGDSITDCDRNKIDHTDLGNGYVNLVNYYIQQHYDNVTCINKGISGNRSKDLKRRWKRSTMPLEQIDILSILIGINDTLRRYDTNLFISKEEFRSNYNYILDTTKEKFPDVKIVLMSPFLLPTEPKQLEWREDLAPKIEIVSHLAHEYNASYIPLQLRFNDKVCIEKPNCYWTKDGVHPSAKGHILIAKEWIDAII
ncbi:MAG: hypothetical protein BEN19_04815 [Epulopiscium sp. Nuni2H_MBin003]|nr:MAG: hypothetical protein BEN19_04815 [Epulopiscium sp. Nuni2H_MBin003]